MNLGNLLKKVAGALARNVPLVGKELQDLIEGKTENAIAELPPEERAKLERELAEIEQEYFRLALRDSADLRELAKMEVQSSDKFVRRTRPGILVGIWVYLGLAVTAAYITALVLILRGDLDAMKVALYVELVTGLLRAIPSELWTAGLVSFIGYGAYRTIDKRNKRES